jgi:ribose-phosphate pyrophosphokinase
VSYNKGVKMILLNRVPINITKFSDNTTQVWKVPKTYVENSVEWYFEDESEIMHLLQLSDILNLTPSRNTLHIDYLPYARQDKDVSNISTFALNSFSKVINLMGFYEVSILDPHSQKALDLINNSVAVFSGMEFIAMEETGSNLACYPDAGAVTKYSKTQDYDYCYGEKERNPLTGEIISYKLIGDCKDKSVLIIDDICDGGMTFILLSKLLYDSGAKEVNLFVSHGIFSKGIDVLYNAGIKNIYTKKGKV